MSKVTMRRPDARAMAQLLAEQTQTAAGLILRLAWRQGLTREEIQRLTWNDVDFSAHQLRLPDRTIPLETETEDCLRRQAERPDPPTPFVVVSDRRRQQMPPESISRLARKTLDRAGLGGISLMDLRHDFIIRHLESHDWPYVARISGIAVPTLYAVFSDYLPEGRQKDSRPRQEVDGFLMWKLLQAEGSSPVGLALWMGWKLGMQVREMTALTWDQVDLDRGLVRLPDRDLALGVTLRRLLRAAAGRRRPDEDPHVLLTPNSRRPLDQPRLSKMVRTALIRGGMEHISLGDLCREERRGTRTPGCWPTPPKKAPSPGRRPCRCSACPRWRPTSVSGSWLSGESWCGSAANTTPPARWCRRRSSMTSSVHFWSSPVRPTGRIWRRSCTSATDSVP